ncbi:MAG TPA: SIR2 family protein [Gaiellaceae bacterium]|nr:SIR2 family protein [Gaiellaceae bacterium]
MEAQVVPFLGAGANLCDRPDNTVWESGRYLPNGYELARALAERSRYPDDKEGDLLRVAQYVDAILGEGQLYRWLHDVFDADYPPSSLHRFLARVPAILRARGKPQQLIVTTNYDDLLERAFAEQGEPYDLVSYEAKRGSHLGRFLHRPFGGEPVFIDRPNKYAELALDETTVILKLHGALDRSNPRRDSYVITEDSYIAYLARRDVGGQIPVALRERLSDSHFLFLGYSLRDWNLRVILNRIWGSQQLDLKSWAVQRKPKGPAAEIEQTLWRDRGDVELHYVPLHEYVSRLEEQVLGEAVATS